MITTTQQTETQANTILNISPGQGQDTIAACIIRDHGAKFYEALNGSSANTRSQAYFLKAVSISDTYKEASFRLNQEGILTLNGKEWTNKRVANRAGTLRKKGVKVRHLKKQGHAGDPVNYAFLKKFGEQL
jgi:hypothetical protein